MFFQKKNPIPEENVAKQSIKKMDRVVTGLLLGGIIASIYGVKKLRGKDIHGANHDDGHHEEIVPDHAPEKKKQSILSRLFFGNK